MPLLAALLLALLHALAPAPRARVERAHAAPVAAVAAVAARDTLGREAARAPREALRAARAPAVGAMARVVDAGTQAPPPRPAVHAPSAPAGRTVAARAPPAGCERSHAVAARGTLRPYFPTAPPLQG